jgi:hypothetical protein
MATEAINVARAEKRQSCQSGQEYCGQMGYELSNLPVAKIDGIILMPLCTAESP